MTESFPIKLLASSAYIAGNVEIISRKLVLIRATALKNPQEKAQKNWRNPHVNLKVCYLNKALMVNKNSNH